jgi:hypothetical protein
LDALRGGCDGHLTRRRCQSADVAVDDGVLVGMFRIDTPWVVIKRVVIQCWCQRTGPLREHRGFEIRQRYQEAAR